ncbi:MarR family transcriptional regulator [Actinomycetospora sp. CA-084318]|uniref:MarR family transcriptional regulator n=1 Tax=Actinomycetospora sp. CA-084318 TaxID=3239892 RepID=UPI003D9577FC
MPDISIVPWWYRSWAAEDDPACARLADLVLGRLLPMATALHRANAVELGLDPTEMAIVEVLGVTPVLRLSALADRVAISHAAASRAAARLEARTWVDRTPYGRGYVDVARAEGTAEVVATSLQDIRGPLAAAAADLTDAERDAVDRFLLELTDLLAKRARSRGDRRYHRTLDRRRKEWLREPTPDR